MLKENVFGFCLDKKLELSFESGIVGALFAPLILTIGLFFSILLYPIFLGVAIANKIRR